MVKFWAGALGGMLLFASGIAHAERPKILVLPVTGKAADAGFRQRVGQALSEGLIASGGEVVALPTGAAALPAEGCTTPACLAGAARATGAAFLLRAAVDEEGRSYTFKLEMLDGQSGAVLAQRENRCEICTDSEALEIANAAASALKAQALKRPVAGRRRPPPAACGERGLGDRASGPRARVTVLDRLELPASLGEFHAKLRTSLEALVREQGLEVVDAPAVSANCRSTSCEEDRLTRPAPATSCSSRAAATTTASRWTSPCAASPARTARRRRAGATSARARRWSPPPRTSPARWSSTSPRAPNASPGGAAAGARLRRSAAAAEGNGGSGLARVLLGAGVAAVGAAGIVAGSFTWHRAGNRDRLLHDGEWPDLRSTYGGKNLGIGMVVGGAILAGVGGYLMIFTGSKTHVRRVRAACPWRERSSVAAVVRVRARAHARDGRVQPEVAEAGLLHTSDATARREMCNPAYAMCERSTDASVDSPEVGDALDGADGDATMRATAPTAATSTKSRRRRAGRTDAVRRRRLRRQPRRLRGRRRHLRAVPHRRRLLARSDEAHLRRRTSAGRARRTRNATGPGASV